MGSRCNEILAYYDYYNLLPEEIEEDDHDQINLYDCVFSLLDESESKREEALTKIIKILERGSRDNDFEKTSVLLLHQSLNFILNGSSLKEVSLSARVIGLLALTAGPGDEFSQLLQKYCLPVIHNRLNFPIIIDFDDTLSLLFCVAIINFIGGAADAAANISTAVMRQHMGNFSGGENFSALLAFGFLLASMDSIPTMGKTVSYLFDSLDCEDTNIITTSAKIIALIFQKHGLSNLDKNLLNFVINKIIYISASNQKIVKSQRKILKGVVEYLETGSIPKKIRRMMVQEELYLQTNSWADLIKLEFLNLFLGEEAFQEHMENNLFLRGLFKVSLEKEKQSLKLIKED